jgi:hypothetical protein
MKFSNMHLNNLQQLLKAWMRHVQFDLLQKEAEGLKCLFIILKKTHRDLKKLHVKPDDFSVK